MKAFENLKERWRHRTACTTVPASPDVTTDHRDGNSHRCSQELDDRICESTPLGVGLLEWHPDSTPTPEARSGDTTR